MFFCTFAADFVRICARMGYAPVRIKGFNSDSNTSGINDDDDGGVFWADRDGAHDADGNWGRGSAGPGVGIARIDACRLASSDRP